MGDVERFLRPGFYVGPLCYPAAGGGCLQHGRDCTKPGKVPLHKWGSESTNDPARAAALLSGRVNRYIDTEKTNLTVIDVDQRHDGGRSFEELLAELGPLPPTVTVLTGVDDHGRRSRHHYFRGDADNPIASSISKIGVGIDVKASAALVVAAGSMHHTGVTYEYAPGLSPDEVAIAPLPAAWAQACREAGEKPDLPEWTPPDGWTPGVDLPDAALQALMFNSSSGAKLLDLFAGRWQEYKPSQSEADASLLENAAWWTNGDFARAEAWFMASALYRPDRWRGTYRASTLAKVRHWFHGGYSGMPSTSESPSDSEPPPGDPFDQTERIRQLERDLAAAREIICVQRERIRELELANGSLRDVQAARPALYRQKHLRTRAKTLEGMAYIISSTAPCADGHYEAIRDDIGRPTGTPGSTIGNDLADLEKRGIIARTAPREIHRPESVDPDTGEIRPASTYQVVRFKPLVSLPERPTVATCLRTFAAIPAAGDEPGRGGARCKKHPDAVIVYRMATYTIEVREGHCEDCGALVSSDELTRQPVADTPGVQNGHRDTNSPPRDQPASPGVQNGRQPDADRNAAPASSPGVQNERPESRPGYVRLSVQTGCDSCESWARWQHRQTKRTYCDACTPPADESREDAGCWHCGGIVVLKRKSQHELECRTCKRDCGVIAGYAFAEAVAD